MSRVDRPYPGYPPNYTTIHSTGGMARTCIVLDLLSDVQLTDAQLAAIQEQLEASLDRFRASKIGLNEIDIVLPRRFDAQLSKGLRLTHK